MWRSFFVFLFLGIYLTPNSALSQDALTNPYLYYYSGKWNAFVVERADGTDSHLLARDVMVQPKDAYNEVVYAEWSPSGEWLAWIVRERSINGQLALSGRGYIINVNGRDLMPVFQGNIVQFSWSPVEDLLFVVIREYLPITKDKFYWVRPDSQIIKVFELDSPAEFDLKPYELTWLANSQTIVVGQMDIPNWYLISTDGTVQTQVVHEVAKGVYDTTFGTQLQGLSPQGRWFHHEQNQLVFGDLNTGQQAYFADMPLEYIFWSPDGQQALLMSDGIWFFEYETTQIHKISNAQINFRPSFDRILQVLWSPDSSHAVMDTQEGLLLHWSYKQQSIQELMILEEGGVGLQWINNSQIAVVNAIYTSPPTPILLHEYDVINNTHKTWDISEPMWLGDTFQISPDGKYLATVGDGAIITDLETEQSKFISPHYSSYFSMPGGIINWDDTGDWLVVIENSSVAGGGGGMTHYGIVNREGNARRDLGGIPQWLPAQVQPDNLHQNIRGSLSVNPTRLISGTGWYGELSWSPDGNLIASRISQTNDNQIQVWEVSTGNLLSELAPFDDKMQIGWQLDAEIYIPIPTPISPTVIIDNQPYVLSPDETIAIYDGYKVYEYHDGELGKLLATFYYSRITQPCYIFFSPDGRYIALGSPWDNAEIWDTQSWHIISTLPNSTTALAFSPDGQTLAVAIAWDIQLWKMDDLP
jgi:WD40 repeat protein